MTIMSNFLRTVTFLSLLILLGCQESGIPPMELVTLDKSKVVVEDGDTYVYDGQRVRMLGIDTPEIDSPYHHGNQDPWGTKASDFLKKKVADATEIQMIRIKEYDPYDRMLAYLILDGRNVNAEIVAAGLAYESVTHYGPQGLDKYAAEVMEASHRQPAPKFEKPWEWRKKHRKEQE
jgi:micrococcal nuclease